MAKKKNSFLLRPDTIIEVIRIKDDEVLKKEMSLFEWQSMIKRKDYRYIAYQKGFSQFKLSAPFLSKKDKIL